MYSGLLYAFKGGLGILQMVEVPTTMLSRSGRRTRYVHKFRLIKIFISFLFSLLQSQGGTVYLRQ
jgi:hypothetical protein